MASLPHLGPLFDAAHLKELLVVDLLDNGDLFVVLIEGCAINDRGYGHTVTHPRASHPEDRI